MDNGEPAIAQQSSAGATRSAAPDYYPPAQTGLRGSHAGSFEVAHRVRDGGGTDIARSTARANWGASEKC